MSAAIHAGNPQPRQRKLASAAADDGIRRRLRHLLEHHTQSEIARRCNVSKSCVNRYLNGTAIPGAFCHSLVTEFGVNPAWLLTGEGTVFLADAAEGASRLAGDLLQVVQGLHAVGRLRIGSLGGKHHRRMLRELSDAMERYETLRDRLNEHSVPVLRTLIEDLSGALLRRDLIRARGLCRTAEQMARFCDDAELSINLAVLQGRLAFLENNLPDALTYTRQAIARTMQIGGEWGEAGFTAVTGAVQILWGWGRFDEAMRVAKTAFAVASEQSRNSPEAHWLAALVGEVQAHAGQLEEGLNAILRARSLITGPMAPLVDPKIARVMLMSGAMNVKSAIAYGADSDAKAYGILGFATFTEREDDIAAALNYWDRMCSPREDEPWQRNCAALTLRALRGETARLVPEVERFREGRDNGTLAAASDTDPPPILRTTLYRLIEKTSISRKLFVESCRAMKDQPEWYTPNILWTARHMRNALALGNEEQKAEARTFFHRHVDNGYACFAACLGG